MSFVPYDGSVKVKADSHDFSARTGYLHWSNIPLGESALQMRFDKKISLMACWLVQLPIKVQLNSMLFAKTLARKDIAFVSEKKAFVADQHKVSKTAQSSIDGEDEFKSKAQVMTLMVRLNTGYLSHDISWNFLIADSGCGPRIRVAFQLFLHLS